jgi:transposase
MNFKRLAQNRAAIKPNMVIVGIDIAKKWHYARIQYPTHQFAPPLRFYNDAQGFLQLLDYIKRHQELAHCDDAIIGFESTGHYWLNLIHWLDKRGFKLVQVNPKHVRHEGDMLDNNPGSSDPKAALAIASMVAEGKYFRVVLPRGIYAELRELVTRRDRLIGQRTEQINLLHAAVDRLFPEFTDVFKSPKGKTALYLLEHYPAPEDLLAVSAAELTVVLRKNCQKNLSLKRIERLQAKARETVGVPDARALIRESLLAAVGAVKALIGQIEAIEGRLKALVQDADESKYFLSVKGIGLITTAEFLGETGSLANYGHAQEIVKMAGYNLYVVQSGKHEGERRITRRGRALLRKVLYMAALRLIQKGMPLHDFYVRVVAHQQRKKKAVVAAACRLVRILYALVRDRRPYCEHQAPLVPQATVA